METGRQIKHSSKMHGEQEPLKNLKLRILPQPSDSTCGPTCLHAVYRHYGEKVSLQDVIAETPTLEGGGTLAVLLATMALRRGYRTKIYTYNLEVFDPSWFTGRVALGEKLRAQAKKKRHRKRLQHMTDAYLEYLHLGGELRFEDLTPRLLTRQLRQGFPILTGLSSTYLYHDPRELPDTTYDDVRGDPQGHFVVFTGYDKERREVHVADPLQTNPFHKTQQYTVPIYRAVGAIFLGVLTHDANLLIIKPPKDRKDPA